MSVRYQQPVPVLFGPGAIRDLGGEVKALNCHKALCVYDGGVKAARIGEKAEESLRQAGIDYVVFDKITADPSSDLVDEGAALAKAQGVDCVIGVGGGSSMDAAKGIALMMANPAPVTQYLTLPPTCLSTDIPIVLVPTTAGTGSEVTPVCVISNLATNEKLGLFLKGHTLAILDPELTLTVPPAVTANTGLDAFCHAVESITAKNRNPRSEVLALDAIRRIVRSLPAACRDGADLAARTELALASNFAGIAFADADNHFGHSLADALSATFHTPHGLNCAWGDPELILLIAPVVPDKIRLIGEAMGLTFSGGETPAQLGEAVAQAVRDLMRQCGIKSPREMGFTREQVVSGAPLAFESGLRFNCPAEITLEMSRTAMEGIYDHYQ